MWLIELKNPCLSLWEVSVSLSSLNPTCVMLDSLQRLRLFLNDLFQFESADLDFGIYKILHYKRAEIRDFINKLLTEKVQEQLAVLDAANSTRLQKELADLQQNDLLSSYLKAKSENPAVADYLRSQPDNARIILQLERLEQELATARHNSRSEEEIYNHLYLFFSRYYDKGDFISKRRFGRSEKYMVPYNGEETHFYWANHDQYYIKSSEYFQQFAFKVPISAAL